MGYSSSAPRSSWRVASPRRCYPLRDILPFGATGCDEPLRNIAESRRTPTRGHCDVAPNFTWPFTPFFPPIAHPANTERFGGVDTFAIGWVCGERERNTKIGNNEADLAGGSQYSSWELSILLAPPHLRKCHFLRDGLLGDTTGHRTTGRKAECNSPPPRAAQTLRRASNPPKRSVWAGWEIGRGGRRGDQSKRGDRPCVVGFSPRRYASLQVRSW